MTKGCSQWFRLTKRTVERLEPGTKDYFIWDENMRGFGVRVYPSGKKVYLVQYRSGRRTRRHNIGQHSVLTAEDARREARRLLGDVARGAVPSAERQAQRSAPTVASLCDRFLDEYVPQHCKPNTARDYHSINRRLIRPVLEQIAIAEVTRADVAAFLHTLPPTTTDPTQASRGLPRRSITNGQKRTKP